MDERLDDMEGPAPSDLPWGSSCGEERCQSRMRRLRSQPEHETGPTKTNTRAYGKDSGKATREDRGAGGRAGSALPERLSNDPRGSRRLLHRLARESEASPATSGAADPTLFPT